VNFHPVAKRPLACSQSRLTGRSRLSRVSAYAFTSCSADGAASMASRSDSCARRPKRTLRMTTNIQRNRPFHLKPASVSNEVCNPARDRFLLTGWRPCVSIRQIMQLVFELLGFLIVYPAIIKWSVRNGSDGRLTQVNGRPLTVPLIKRSTRNINTKEEL